MEIPKKSAMNKVYINSFYPLCYNKRGINAIKHYNLSPYIDGSCRREPDFEHQLPCITGLCRPGFAEKLKEKDTVIYLTNKKGIGVRKIVAILEVIIVCANHQEAAKYYEQQNWSLPNNLMVENNLPNPLEKTHFSRSPNIGERDFWYKERAWAPNSSKVAICKVLYLNTENPISFPKYISKRKLTAQNPPVLMPEEYEKLYQYMNLNI